MINIIIVAFLSFVVFWNAPAGGLIRRIVGRLSKPAVWFGLSYNWSMYAPEAPLSTDFIEVHAETSDGQKVDITPPHFNVRGDYGRTRSLRMITLQRNLMGDHSEPSRTAVCRDAEKRYASGQSVDSAPANDARPVIRNIVLVKVTVDTPQFFSQAESPRAVHSRVLKNFTPISGGTDG